MGAACEGWSVVELGSASVAASFAGMLLADNGARVVKVEPPWASIGAGHEAFAGVLAALMVREQTGRGQHLDTTLVNGLSALDYFGTMHWQAARAKGMTPGATPNSGAALLFTRTMLYHATKDSRFLTTTGMLPKEMRALCRVTGQESMFDDPRFANAPRFAAVEDAQAWEMAMWEAFRTKTYDEGLTILRGDPDIAFEGLASSEEGLDHPQIVHNGDEITIDDPEHGPVRMVGPVAHFDRTPSRIERLAPAHGSNHGPLTGPARPSARGASPAHALDGITIVECGYFFAMPFAMTLAASLGARVIKIEGKDGDPFRNVFGGETGAARVMEGKHGLSVDLAHPESRELMHRLIGGADAFVTSFRPGAPERLGLDYATLHG